MIKLLKIKLRLVDLRIRLLVPMTFRDVRYLSEKIEKIEDDIISSIKCRFIKTVLIFEIKSLRIIYLRRLYDLLLEKEG